MTEITSRLGRLLCKIGLHDNKRVEDFHHNPEFPIRRWECQRPGCDNWGWMTKYRSQSPLEGAVRGAARENNDE